MQKIRKYFGEFEMTWKRVILLAVITAVYTALINQIRPLYDTSFQDIAINFDCWFLFAIFIIVNCKKCWEASLKCFVFFLISQPLIYLIEVPFVVTGWHIFDYYGYWFIITLLTLPGAAIAYQLKRKNWLSVAVLSVATGFLSYSSVKYLSTAIWNFPHHLLSSIFCLALAVFFVLVLLDEKKHRIAALGVILAVVILTAVMSGEFSAKSEFIGLDDGKWTCTVDDPSIVEVTLDGNTASVKALHDGSTYVYFENGAGDEVCYYITATKGSLWLSQFD